jgi:dihydroorotate dehydrogenase
LYRCLRPLLFRLDAEASHHLAFAALRVLQSVPGATAAARALYGQRATPLAVKVMGIEFPNPVGLAAGLDKNAEAAAWLGALGFGFIEVGTVTPRPQPGNPCPRLFRLPAQRAVINRMGFNNDGAAALVANLARHRPSCPVGINIGKNKDTPNERAVEDYLGALRTVYAHADYVTVNISSPNTPGLRALQEGGQLEELLRALKAEQAALARTHDRYVPIALKIAPDLDDEQLAEIARLLLAHRFDAVIATNTTVTRPGLANEPLAGESGGLSGRPLKSLSTEIIRKLYGHLRGAIPIIGVGGIETAEDAWEKLVAGADLVQIYSVLVFDGPLCVQEIVNGLARKITRAGPAAFAESLSAARAAD